MVWFLTGAHGAVAETVLIPPGAVWRYSADGTAQPLAWRGLSFDDSPWFFGPAVLGYGEGDEATVIAQPATAPVTAYFRKSFQISNQSEFSTLTMRLRSDDGAAVYLNSNEVYRSNLPMGPILPTTRATNEVSAAAERQFVQRSLPAFRLLTGTNVLAVELHQHANSQNDASFDLALIGNIPNSYPAVTLHSPEDGGIVAPGNMLLSVSASDADGHIYRVNFHAGATLSQAETNIIAGLYEPPFEFTWRDVPAGRYVVSALATDNSGARPVRRRCMCKWEMSWGTRSIAGLIFRAAPRRAWWSAGGRNGSPHRRSAMEQTRRISIR